MRSKTLAVLATLWLSSGIRAEPLTLAEAMNRAEAASPAVHIRSAQLDAVEGLRREASRPFFHNPELSVERARRRGDGTSSADEWTVGISHAIETGGQQGRRREAAAASLALLRAEVDDLRRQARADAATRFQEIVAAQRRVDLERRSTGLFDSVSQAVARRRAAGEDTRLDANVAVVEAERARNALGIANEQLLNARSELATLLQLPGGQLPEVVPQPLDDVAAAVAAYDLEAMLRSVPALPRLRALSAREAAARSRLAVERANRYPDVTVGLSTGREGFRSERERLTALTVSLPLPIWKRNEAAIGQAVGELAQAEIAPTLMS